MKAKKGNKTYTITPGESRSYQKAGFDIYGDNGALIAYGAGKTVSVEQYIDLKNENQKLRDQIDALVEKLEKSKKAKKVN